jgi:predicted aspartyl protease
MDGLGVVAVALVIAAAGCVQIGSQPGRVDPAPGEVSFELAGPGGAALVVPVEVNGEGPFPFILDTGATLTCLDEALVMALDLRDAPGTVGVGGGLQGFGRMRVVSIDSVAVGEARATDLLGCAVDLSSMQQAGLDVRGLLGLNFLKAYRVTLDFTARTVRLDPPQTAAAG